MSVRILRAVLIGPAVVPAAAFVFAMADGFRLRESAAVAAIYAAFSYGGTVMLGLPAHWFFERKRLGSFWHYVIAGTLLGIVVALLVTMFMEPAAVPNTGALLVFGLSGAFTAAVFRAIARAPE